MRLLLDTHVWLWMNLAPERLNSRARGLLTDPENDLFFSAASAWEIAIKFRLGKLRLPSAPARYVPSRLVQTGTTPLAITQEHALSVSRLPEHHNDPFDRILVAQARLERMTILTADRQIERYPVKVIRAD